MRRRPIATSLRGQPKRIVLIEFSRNSNEHAAAGIKNQAPLAYTREEPLDGTGQAVGHSLRSHSPEGPPSSRLSISARQRKWASWNSRLGSFTVAHRNLRRWVLLARLPAAWHCP